MLGWTFKSDYDIEFTPPTNFVFSVNNHDLSQTFAGNWGLSYMCFWSVCLYFSENLFERCTFHFMIVLYYLPLILGRVEDFTAVHGTSKKVLMIKKKSRETYI